jgi:hypothetical protein
MCGSQPSSHKPLWGLFATNMQIIKVYDKHHRAYHSPFQSKRLFIDASQAGSQPRRVRKMVRVKVPIFLRVLKHRGWDKARSKRSARTGRIVGTFLAGVCMEDAKNLFFLLLNALSAASPLLLQDICAQYNQHNTGIREADRRPAIIVDGVGCVHETCLPYCD